MPPVEADEREQQGERNGCRHDQRGAHAEQEQPQDNQHQHHAAQQVGLDGAGGLFHQPAAIVKRDDLDVGWQHVAVEVRGQVLHALQNHLRLFAHPHEDDAFDGVVLAHIAELAETHGVADLDLGHVLHVDGNAAPRRQHDVADVLGVPDEAQAADVVELPPLGVKAAAGVRVIGAQLL